MQSEFHKSHGETKVADFFGCQMHRSINLQYTLSRIVDFLGDQVEERLTFLSEGTTPRKNLEVMQEAIKEAWKTQEKTHRHCFEDGT